MHCQLVIRFALINCLLEDRVSRTDWLLRLIRQNHFILISLVRSIRVQIVLLCLSVIFSYRWKRIRVHISNCLVVMLFRPFTDWNYLLLVPFLNTLLLKNEVIRNVFLIFAHVEQEPSRCGLTQLVSLFFETFLLNQVFVYLPLVLLFFLSVVLFVILSVFLVMITWLYRRWNPRFDTKC